MIKNNKTKKQCLTKQLRVRFRIAHKHGRDITELINLYALIITKSKACGCKLKYCRVYQAPVIIKEFTKTLEDNLFALNRFKCKKNEK